MRSSRPGFLLTLVLPAAPIGSADAHDHLVKEFAGGVAGRSTTQFSYAFDDVSGVGTYVAMEAFGGSLDGQPGSFAFAHSATSDGRSPERLAELFVIAPGSGTGELAGLTGGGRIINAEDGTHAVEIDDELGAVPT